MGQEDGESSWDMENKETESTEKGTRELKFEYHRVEY